MTIHYADDGPCRLCGYDRRGGASPACPECGFDADQYPCLLARDPNETREVAVQVALLVLALVAAGATYYAFGHALLMPAPFAIYAIIVIALLAMVVGIFQMHHRSNGWTLLLRIEHDGLSFWSRRSAARGTLVPWQMIRHIEVAHVRSEVFVYRLRYEFACRLTLTPPLTLFVAADNARALLFAAAIAERVSRQRTVRHADAALIHRSESTPARKCR